MRVSVPLPRVASGAVCPTVAASGLIDRRFVHLQVSLFGPSSHYFVIGTESFIYEYSRKWHLLQALLARAPQEHPGVEPRAGAALRGAGPAPRQTLALLRLAPA